MMGLLAGLLQATAVYGADLSADSRQPSLERGGLCGLDRPLCLDSAAPRPAAVADGLFRTRRLEQDDDTAIQRPAGAIADRMDAGHVGSRQFKVILE